MTEHINYHSVTFHSLWTYSAQKKTPRKLKFFFGIFFYFYQEIKSHIRNLFPDVLYYGQAGTIKEHKYYLVYRYFILLFESSCLHMDACRKALHHKNSVSSRYKQRCPPILLWQYTVIPVFLPTFLFLK